MRAVKALACCFIVSLALLTICDAAAAPAPQLSADSLSALGTGFSKKLASALRQQEAQQAAKTQSTDAHPSPVSASQAKVATAAAGSSDAAASTAAADVFEVPADSQGYYGDEYDQYYVAPKITLGDYLQKLFADLDKEYEAVEKEFKQGIEASRDGLYQKLHEHKERYNSYDSYGDKSDSYYNRDEYHSYDESYSNDKHDKYNNKHDSKGDSYDKYYSKYHSHSKQSDTDDKYDSYGKYDKRDKYPKYDSYDNYNWYGDKEKEGQYPYDSSTGHKCPFSDEDLCHIYNSNGKDSYKSYPGYGGKIEAACFKEVAHTGCQKHDMTDEMERMMKHRKQYTSALGCCTDAHHPPLDHFLTVGTAAYGYENRYDSQGSEQEELTLFNPRGSHSECVWDIWYYHTPAEVDQWTTQVGTATATCYFGSEVSHCGHPITKGLTVTIAADVYKTEAVSKQGPEYPMGSMPRMGGGCKSYDVGYPEERTMPIQAPEQPSSTPSLHLTPPAAKRAPPSVPQQKVTPVTPPQQKVAPVTPPQPKQQTPAKAPAAPVPLKQALPLLEPIKPTQQKQAPAKPAVPPQQKQAPAKAPATPSQQKQAPAASVPKAQPAQPKAPVPVKAPVPTVPKKTNVPAALVPTPAPKTPAPAQTPKVAAPAPGPAATQPAPVPASTAPASKAPTAVPQPATPAAKPATPAAKPAAPAAKPHQPQKAAPAPTKAPGTAKLATAAKLQWAVPAEAEPAKAEPADDLWAKLSNRLARFADYRGAKEAMVSIASVGTASTSSDVPFFQEPRMQYDDSPILYADKSFYDTVGNIRNTANIISNGHGWDTGMYHGKATIITGVVTSVTGLGKDAEYHQGMVEHVIKFDGEILTAEKYKNLPFDVPHIKPGTYKIVFTGDKHDKEY